MHTTSVSLLERLRQPNSAHDWTRFVALYTPLLFHWAHATGLREADAADLVQDVLTLLVQQLPRFSYEPSNGRFRAWLKTLTLNRYRDLRRQQAGRPAHVELASAPEPAAANGVGVLEEAEYRQYLVARALQLMKTDFRPTTWQACWEHAAMGRPAAEVAAELGISEGAVYVAKSRVLSQLRRELSGLL